MSMGLGAVIRKNCVNFPLPLYPFPPLPLRVRLRGLGEGPQIDKRPRVAKAPGRYPQEVLAFGGKGEKPPRPYVSNYRI